MKILLIEDDRRVAGLVEQGLTADGNQVRVTDSGQSALEQAASTVFDIIVLDVGIPEPDGFEVCRILRAEGFQGGILMLTARDALDDRVYGLSLGADDYLVKPFSFQELLARIHALSRRPPNFVADRDRELTCGPLTWDPASAIATFHGEPLSLTPKESQVLEILLRNVNRVVTREVILDRVWGLDFDPGTNVVDAVVKRLRGKLRIVSEQSVIHTVRGFGYRLRV